MRLAFDYKLEQGITVELSTDKCTETNTQRETTLTLSPRDACCVRHLRWIRRRGTSQFRGLCSNTTTREQGLSHQTFPVGCVIILHLKTVTGLHHTEVLLKKRKRKIESMYNKIQIA